MSETYTSVGLVGSTVQRATVAEAATGTHGQEFMRDDITKLADKTRFLDDAGFPNVSKVMFPAVQVPSVGVNDLDDYKEGTWTAAFTSATGSITIDPTIKTGAYTKIGRQVTVTGYFNVTAVSSPTGALNITGLPYPCAAGNQFSVAVAIWVDGLLATAATMVQARIDGGTSVILIRHFAAGVAAAAAADVQAGATFMIQATYFA